MPNSVAPPPVLPPLRLTRHVTLERCQKQNSSTEWTWTNIRGQIHLPPPPGALIREIQTRQGERGESVADVATASDWRPAKVGDIFGPAWATHWFRLRLVLPECKDLALVFDINAEAAVYCADGTFVCSLVGGDGRERRDTVLLHGYASGEAELYVEVACNGLFGVPFPGTMVPDEGRTFPLAKAELAVFDRDAWDLRHDFNVVYGIADQTHVGDLRQIVDVDAQSSTAVRALKAANAMVNIYDRSRRETWGEARKVAQCFLRDCGVADAHTAHVFGHCHIDTAWLWPIAETRRKVARSWGNVLELQKEYANLPWSFVLSQAAQMAMLEEDYPAIFKGVQKAVAEGRMHIVGGAWVEMDGNIPSGESFVRQFLYGQRYLQQRFGRTAKVFFLPDTFGYASQLPQIASDAGMPYFITQKLSWNLVNKMPHSSFIWEGLDGSSILTHFPPADTYCSELSVKELRDTEKNNRSKDRADASMVLFGYGDGGGGPTRAMLERLTRVRGTKHGLPRVETESSPEKFFAVLEKAANIGELKRWRGELYFELHQGTFTTHAQVKRRNLHNELALRDVEILSVAANLHNNAFCYPTMELERLWKLLLVNQFHDIMPGSSIGVVFEDAHADYDAIESATPPLLTPALDALGISPASVQSDASTHISTVINTASWHRSETVEVPIPDALVKQMKALAADDESHVQLTADGTKAIVHMEMPPFGAAHISLPPSPSEQKATRDSIGMVSMNGFIHPTAGDCFELTNKYIRAVVQKSSGAVVELSQRDGPNCLAPGTLSNRFLLFDDVPFFWVSVTPRAPQNSTNSPRKDAWDTMAYAHEKYVVCDKVESSAVTADGPLRCAASFSISLSANSKLNVEVALDAGARHLTISVDVDWHEAHKFLKADFTVGVHSPAATYGAAFGNLVRPNHMNTSWDEARYEVPTHGFVDVSEWGKGFALLTGAKYGASCYRNGLRLSLLRAPKSPDANADMGHHRMSYAMMPHEGDFRNSVVRPAKAFRMQPLVVDTPVQMPALVKLIADIQHGVIVDTIKAAEDDDGSLIIRLYESFGGTAQVALQFGWDVQRVVETNLLEESDDAPELASNDDGNYPITLGAFKVKTLRVWGSSEGGIANGS